MKKFDFLLLISVFWVSASWATPGFSDDGLQYKEGKEERAKKLEFEGGLVEGVNSKPGDVGSITTKDKYRKKSHIYNRQMFFDSDLNQTLKDMRYEL